MPRRRTIACDYCGHMLLKRDEYCEVCGRMSRRERALWTAKAVQIGVVALICLVGYLKLKAALPH